MMNVYVMVQFYPWFEFYFPLFWGMIIYVVIFLDFHSAEQGLPLVDSWSRGLD